MAKTPKNDLFVSDAKADRARAESCLLDTLKNAGVKIDSKVPFALGSPPLTKFEHAVGQSKRPLLVKSPAYSDEMLCHLVEARMLKLAGEESGAPHGR